MRNLLWHDFCGIQLAQMFMKLFLNGGNLMRVNGVSAPLNVGVCF
jgi:hypothetical protein